MSRFNKSLKALLIPAALVISFASTSPVQANDVQDLKTKLDKAKLVYTINSNDDFDLTYTLKNGRKQKVRIFSYRDTYADGSGGLRFRPIASYTPAFPNGIPLDVKKQVLQNSNTMKMGGWSILESLNGDTLAFMARVEGDMSVEDLSTVALWVAEAADAMEQKLFNVDEK